MNDYHLREANDARQNAIIARTAQRARNRAEWQRRAHAAIRRGEVFLAIQLLEQGERE